MQTQEIQKDKLPDGWEIRKLGDVCIINPKKSEIKEIPEDLEVSFIPMNFVDEKEGMIKKQEIRRLKDVKKGYTYFRENDVLFAKITPCMENGKSAIAINLKNDIGFGSTEFHVIRPNKDLLSDYIFHFIRQPSFRGEAASKMSGTAGQLRVPVNFLEDYEIPVPLMEEQKRITNKLNEIFQHYNKLKKEKQKAKEQYDRILQSAIANLIPKEELPEEWEEKELGKLVTCHDGMRIPLNRQQRNKMKGTYPYWGASGIVDYINDYRFTGTYLLLSEDGENLRSRKKSICYIASGKFWVNNHIHVLLPHSGIDIEFLWHYLEGLNFEKFLIGTTRPKLNQKIMMKIKVSVPKDAKEQKRISKILSSIKSKIDYISTEQTSISSQLSFLPKSVLSKAFRGELV